MTSLSLSTSFATFESLSVGAGGRSFITATSTIVFTVTPTPAQATSAASGSAASGSAVSGSAQPSQPSGSQLPSGSANPSSANQSSSSTVTPSNLPVRLCSLSPPTARAHFLPRLLPQTLLAAEALMLPQSPVLLVKTVPSGPTTAT
jgi:hypothetical protein